MWCNQIENKIEKKSVIITASMLTGKEQHIPALA